MTPYLPTDIEQRPIGDLLPYARNARTYSEGQILQVAASIREFGWTNPTAAGHLPFGMAGKAKVHQSLYNCTWLRPSCALTGRATNQS